jgi:1-deoxy-D-xylulose-5-phosphate synthase
MPLDKDCIRVLAGSHDLLVTMEENVASGGFGEHVAAMVGEEQLPVQVLRIAIPDRFVEHGSVDELRRALGIDADSIVQKIAACPMIQQESL